MTISSVEFIRRFMLHILPEKFMKIRQYGFLSNRYKKEKLGIIREYLQAAMDNTILLSEVDKSINEVYTKEPLLCPHCNQGTLAKSRKVPPFRNYYSKVGND
jgi:hypothetical protein